MLFLNTYFDLLISELRVFSQKNSWVYFVLFFCLVFIYFTGTGSIREVLGVFLIYVAAEICMMTMITLIEEKNYIASSLFQLLGNIIFTALFVYHFFHSGQYQYALGSIGFILGAIKNISKYHFHYPLSFIQGGSLFLFNLLLFYFVYGLYSNITFQILFQVIGWTFFSTCLVMTEKHISLRYFLGLFGLFFMVIGSSFGIYNEFLGGNIYGVTVCYFLMPLTVFLVYIKSVRKYL